MRKIIAHLLLLLGSLAVTLLLAEVILRLIGFSAPYFTQVDEWTGFALRPGAAGWQTEEGRAFIHVNSDGLRDREHAKAKPPNTLRIAVLGDSYTEARQVPLEKTYWWLMGGELTACPSLKGREIEVINFGVSGFGTTQELQELRHRVWEFSPDIVLLQFTTGNDVRNNSFALEQNTQKPYFRSQSGALVLDDSFRSTSFFRNQTSWKSRSALWSINHSRVLQLLNQARVTLSHRSTSTAEKTPEGIEAGLDEEIYRPPQDEAWKEAWTITEDALRTMAEETRVQGSVFVVMVATNGIQVHPDRSVRENVMRNLQVSDLFYPDQRIAALGAKDGFPVLTLAESMQRTAEEEHVYFHGFPNTMMGSGHWNEEGHAFAGRAAADFLCVHTVGQ